jgi:tetratricopeptide (TPR) repeat protein
VLLVVLLPAPWAATAATQPPASDPAAERLLLESRRLEQQGELETALGEYEILVQRFPASPQAEEALLRLAQGRLALGDSEAARQAAEKIVAQNPTSPNAAGALVFLGDLAAGSVRSPSDLEGARAIFRRVPALFGIDAFPQLGWRAEARVRAGEVSLLLGEPRAAAASFVRAVEDEPLSRWTARARLGWSQALIETEDWVAAAEVLQGVLLADRDPAGPQLDAAVLAAARQRLTLLHRLVIRPAAGQNPWQTTRTLPASGVALKNPSGVSVDASARVAVTDGGLGTALVIADGSVEHRSAYAGDGRPSWGVQGPSPLEAGPLWLPSESVVRDPLSGVSESFVTVKGGKQEPLKKLVAAEKGIFGQRWILDQGSQQVYAAPAGASKVEPLAESETADIALDALGRLWVLSAREPRIRRFGTDGNPDGTVVSGGWRKPEALAVDRLGNLYVLDRAEPRIDVLDRRGRRITSLGPALPGGLELRNPQDLAVDDSGRVYVVDRKSTAVLVVE